MVPPASHGFLVSRGTLVPSVHVQFRIQGCHLLCRAFQRCSARLSLLLDGPATPALRRRPVWPLSSSLATTKEIDVSFFSSGYLDVSVPRVPLVRLWIHRTMTGVRTCRVSPFGHLWINACLRLPTAFRSLPRPSSAISARASSLCSYSLDLFWLPHAPSGSPSGPPLPPLFSLLPFAVSLPKFFPFGLPFSALPRSQCASRFLLCAVFKERSQADA